MPKTHTETLDERYFGHEHIIVIEPPKGWQALDLKELWAYRELLLVLTMRDIKVRYKQTVLGFAWAIIQPVMMMVVFSIIFGQLAQMPSDGFPYSIFVYVALLPWTLFANSITASGNSLIASAQLVSKVYFPRLIIPLAAVGGTLVDFVIATGVLFILMIYYGIGWGLNLFMLPLLVACLIFTAVGVGTLLAALIVAYRDVRYIVSFMVQLWLFATPVAYPASLVPDKWRWLLYLNPMAGIIEGFRSSFLDRPFDFTALSISVFVAVLMFIFGVAYFEKVERRFADII